MPATDDYDALLLVSFGGPEGPADVLPFLENVTRGRGIPRERLVEVGRHYDLFGGVSPINGQNRELLSALREHLAPLPVYWGNRNWDPFLADTLRQMRADGIRRAAGYVTSAYSSYSGCRQYREDIARAQAEVGPGAPEVHKLRVFYNHPLFVECFADATRAALARLPEPLRAGAQLAFTAHSIPLSMAAPAAYEAQLRETARLVATSAGARPWSLSWNSRSGPPQVPWLEPDISEELTRMHAAGVPAAVIVPIGFVSDHMEVGYDLDTVAVPQAPMPVVRAATPGTDPRLVAMVGELLAERTRGLAPRWLGPRGPSPVDCLAGCCPAPRRLSPGRPAEPVSPARPAGR